MATYLHPGVYVEEIPSGSRPIEGVATSIGSFVGYTGKGPLGEPVLISSWDEYSNRFGGILDLGKTRLGDPMGHSVNAFFQNGGTTAYIVRITEDWRRTDSSIAHAEKAYAYVDHPRDVGRKAFKFSAVNEGRWANKFTVKILPGIRENSAQLYDIVIGEALEDPNGNPSFVIHEKFVNASLDENDPRFIRNIVEDGSNIVTVELIDDVSALNFISDQYQGSSTGGDLAALSLDFTGLSSDRRKLVIDIDGSGEKTIQLDAKNFSDLNQLATHITEKVRQKVPGDEAYAAFSCSQQNNRLVLTSGTRKPTSSVKVETSKPATVTDPLARLLKLGIPDGHYLGFSRSASLLGSADIPLVLSDTARFADAAARTLSGTVDGQPFSQDLGVADLADLAAISAAISAVVGLTCSVNNNTLVLTSDTRQASSAVTITSNLGIAPLLRLGKNPLDNGGEELSGQQNHEREMTRGVSISGELPAATTSIDLAGADFPDNASRTLTLTIDGGPAVTLLVGGTTPAAMTITEIATAINAVAGLSCSYVGNRLVLMTASKLNNSAIQVDPGSRIAVVLRLGVDPANGGEEMVGRLYHDANFREQVSGQESADRSLPHDKLDQGSDGELPATPDYEAVFSQFIKYRDINIICLPGKYWHQDGSGDPVVQAAIGHAEFMKNRMVIVDPHPGYELTDPNKVIAMGLPSQTYCVVYYPWAQTANRFYHAERNPGVPKTLLVPPSGYAAGMWSKIDGRRGVWKAPAGMGTGLLGLSGLEYRVEDLDQDSLNPLGVNCLRSMPGAGRVIWGARTRATRTDPEWRYVPVRRTAIMIEESIYRGIQWAVFEPNDHRLWASLRANIGNFMNGLFRAGAFQGEKASDAYFVRCGKGDTMTQGDIDAGQVIVVVGFAPLKPAEFVIVRIQQKVDLEQP